MEVHFTPETEQRIRDLAHLSGGATPDRFVQDVVEGYLDEIAKTRQMLDTRYNDVKSGRVKPISGDAVEAHFRAKSASARRSQ